MKAEFEQLAREAAQSSQTFEQYLLRLTELEVSARAANTLNSRIRQAQFPVHKDLDTYDFSALPSISKQKVLELARGEWITQHASVCLIGQPGTGKTHLSIALGLAACREGVRTKFFTAAALVNQLEEAQKKFGLDQFLKRLDNFGQLTTTTPRRSNTHKVGPISTPKWGRSKRLSPCQQFPSVHAPDRQAD